MSLRVHDTDWLAGLWEAEGSFTLNHGYPRVSIGMTDLDVIKHVVRLVGIPKKIYRWVHKHEKHSDSYHLSYGKKAHRNYLFGLLCGRLFQRRHDKLCTLNDTTIPYTEPKLTLPWLAGYLEGEATFVYFNTPLIRLRTTDLDVLTAMRDYMGVGNIYPVKRRSPGYVDPNGYNINLDKRRDVYQWGIYGDNARYWMRTLYPMMSVWRQFQIRRALLKNDIDYTMPVRQQEEILGLC